MTEIETLSITELKALVYDELVKAETAQKNIIIINKELSRRLPELQEEIKEPESKYKGIP